MFQRIMLHLLKKQVMLWWSHLQQARLTKPRLINVLLLIINSLTLGDFDQEMTWVNRLSTVYQKISEAI